MFSRSVRATRAEAGQPLPGDDLIPKPAGSLTHAVTIRRPPRDVWPWLAQMGAGSRAGWYSYDFLDNGRQPSARRIVPELQTVTVGMVFPAGPGVTDGFTLLAFEPEHFLVLGWLSTDGSPLVTWASVLQQVEGGTRLVVRARGGPAYALHGLPPWISQRVIRFVHFVMQRKQLLGIAERTERSAPVTAIETGRRTMPLASAAVFVAVLSSALWAGSRRQQRAVAWQLEKLRRVAISAPPHGAIDSLDSLPAPVARYLRWALPETPSMGLVRMKQRGTLRTDTETGRWMPFEAEHLSAPGATAFVWNARVAVAPLLDVRVRDAYIEGEGSGHVSLLSAFGISAASGTPEMNSGSLHRFLAEAVWYPVALLPGPTLRWSPIDSSRALATLTDHGISVSLEFRFADTGEVTGIYTPARWGTFGGGYEQRPWEGHFRNYERTNGFRVPTEGEVGWYVDDQWRAVWKGTILEFDVSRQQQVPAASR